MKKIISLFLFLLIAVGLAYAGDKDQIYQGTLVDSKCYVGANGMLKGNDHMGVKDCGTLCAKQGIPVAVIGSDNKTHMILASSVKLAPYIGQEARVTGKLDSGSNGIIAAKVEVQKDGKWKEVNLGADMM